jgi:hypothetical protein
MEIKGIEDPFKWSRELVSKIQIDSKGLYYSPSRKPGQTSEGNIVTATPISLDGLTHLIKPSFNGYFKYIWDFIQNMNEVFEFGDDYGIYIPEVKYLSPEPLVDYTNLALTEYPNVHFVGDALSARGITVSGAQGIYVAESLLS